MAPNTSRSGTPRKGPSVPYDTNASASRRTKNSSKSTTNNKAGEEEDVAMDDSSAANKLARAAVAQEIKQALTDAVVLQKTHLEEGHQQNDDTDNSVATHRANDQQNGAQQPQRTEQTQPSDPQSPAASNQAHPGNQQPQSDSCPTQQGAQQPQPVQQPQLAPVTVQQPQPAQHPQPAQEREEADGVGRQAEHHQQGQQPLQPTQQPDTDVARDTAPGTEGGHADDPQPGILYSADGAVWEPPEAALVPKTLVSDEQDAADDNLDGVVGAQLDEEQPVTAIAAAGVSADAGNHFIPKLRWFAQLYRIWKLNEYPDPTRLDSMGRGTHRFRYAGLYQQLSDLDLDAMVHEVSLLIFQQFPRFPIATFAFERPMIHNNALYLDISTTTTDAYDKLAEARLMFRYKNFNLAYSSAPYPSNEVLLKVNGIDKRNDVKSILNDLRAKVGQYVRIIAFWIMYHKNLAGRPIDCERIRRRS